MDKGKTIVLYSSDSNPQYKKDIVNIIALPINGTYKFRYKEKYLSDDLKAQINEGINGKEALVVFRTNSVEPGIEPFFVPIRWVVIDSVDLLDTIFIFHFTAKEYPSFSEEYRFACMTYEKNVELSKSIFRAEENRNSLFATYEPFNYINAKKAQKCSCKSGTEKSPKQEDNNIATIENLEEESEEKKQEKAWICIIEALSKYDGFKSTFFYKTRLELPPDTKSLKMLENKPSIIEVWHYNSDYNGVHSASVQIIYDSEVLVSSCGGREKIECRYDKNEYSFTPKDIRHNVDSQITLDFITEETEHGSSHQQEATIRIPITIERTMVRRYLHTGLGTGGAVFLAIGEMLSGAPGWQMALKIIGSILLGVVWLVPGGD